MASAFSHAIVASALGMAWQSKRMPLRFWLLGPFCAAVPDLDVVSFWMGIPYEHVLGHRGVTHSLAFAICLSGVVVVTAFRAEEWRETRLRLWTYFFAATASHGLLDAMTDGGLGVAFFAPFENARYFFPFRPILVSPVEPEKFFTARTWAIILSELKWIGFPCLFLFAVLCAKRCLRRS
ncbi:MAG: metal-dependent hydrolase [Nitrospiraceae bacterium]